MWQYVTNSATKGFWYLLTRRNCLTDLLLDTSGAIFLLGPDKACQLHCGKASCFPEGTMLPVEHSTVHIAPVICKEPRTLERRVLTILLIRKPSSESLKFQQAWQSHTHWSFLKIQWEEKEKIFLMCLWTLVQGFKNNPKNLRDFAPTFRFYHLHSVGIYVCIWILQTCI